MELTIVAIALSLLALACGAYSAFQSTPAVIQNRVGQMLAEVQLQAGDVAELRRTVEGVLGQIDGQIQVLETKRRSAAGAVSKLERAQEQAEHQLPDTPEDQLAALRKHYLT